MKPVDELQGHQGRGIVGAALVPTITGPKRIDELVPGSLIYAWAAEVGVFETPIVAQQCCGEKPMVTVETASRRIRVSAEHPLLVIEVAYNPHPERSWFLKGVGQYEWKQASDIRVGDIVVCAYSYYRQEAAADHGVARLVGAFLGDGWVRHDTSNGRYTVGLAIGNSTDIHTERYAQLLTEVLPPARWRSNTSGAFGLTCSSRAVWEAVSKLGLAYESKQKRVPVEAFGWSVTDKLALLAGYFDSDGSIGRPETSNHGRGIIGSASADLAASLREIAIGCSLAVTPIQSGYQTTNFGTSMVHRCVLRADAAATLDLWHEEKRARLRTTPRPDCGLRCKKLGYLSLPDGTFAQRVRNVRHGEPEVVYNLSVDHPSRAFVCEGVIVQ